MHAAGGSLHGKRGEVSHVDGGAKGSSCPGPTLAEVEKHLASASLDGGLTSGQQANVQLHATWK